MGVEQEPEGEEDAAEAGLAAFGVIPFAVGVSAAAGAAGAEGDGVEAHGEGDVGIGGGAIEAGLDTEVLVDGAEDVEKGGIGRELTAGAGADFANTGGEAARGFQKGGAFVFPDQGAFDAIGEEFGELIEDLGGFAAEVELGAGRDGDGIDAGAAVDEAEVGGAAAVAGVEETGAAAVAIEEVGDGAGQGVDGVGVGGIAPTVAAGTGEDDFEAAAAEGLGGEVFDTGAVEDEEGGDLGGEGALAAQEAHSAEIALSLLADVGDEERGAGRGGGGGREGVLAGQGEQGGETGAIVGDTGAEKAAIGGEADFFAGAGGEDGIEVGGNGDEGGTVLTGEMGDDVAGAVEPGVVAEGSELFDHPEGAFFLEEGRGGDAAELEVFFVDPGAIAAQLAEGFGQGKGLGEAAQTAAGGEHEDSVP